jgi:hypothetical protein
VNRNSPRRLTEKRAPENFQFALSLVIRFVVETG